MSESVEEIRKRMGDRNKQIDEIFKEQVGHLDGMFQELKNFEEVIRIINEYVNNKEKYDKQIQEQGYDYEDKESDVTKIVDYILALGYPDKFMTRLRKLERKVYETKSFTLSPITQSIPCDHVWEACTTTDIEVFKWETENYIDFLRLIKIEYEIPEKGINLMASRDFPPTIAFEECCQHDRDPNFLDMGLSIARKLGYTELKYELKDLVIEDLANLDKEEYKEKYGFVIAKGIDFAITGRNFEHYCKIIDGLVEPGGFLIDCEGLGERFKEIGIGGYTEIGEEKHKSRVYGGLQANNFYIPRLVKILKKETK